MIGMSSRIIDIYRNPIGRDLIRKILLQLGWSEKLMENRILGSVRLSWIHKLSFGRVDKGLLESIVTLLNTEDSVPEDTVNKTHAWWKEAVFYQVYPRSFMDSNGDGIGDLRGLISRLDYLSQLGIDALWLSPVYDSPNDDNGYDIRDYRKIMADFGTMEDFDELISELHRRGMRLLMDLVVNHTSDEHEWFREAVSDPGGRYGDYYFFRDRPNNWTSYFGGSAWRYIEERKQYAMHLFSPKQIDLNWENDDLRKDVRDIIRWWLEKGVDGFRLDVINYISKPRNLPDGSEVIGKLMGYTGVETYFYGPRLNEYLRELKNEAFLPYGAFTVGETPGVGIEMMKLLTAEGRRELDMVFSFDHLETPGHARFDEYRYDLNYYKSFMIDHMESYSPFCQMSLFYENHDNPRMISKVDTDVSVRWTLGKLLAVMQLTLKGTPFIFQGQEIGMVNKSFRSMEDLRDVESFGKFSELKEKIGEEQAFRRVLAGTRDNARIPMQWNRGKNGGFTEGTPWIVTGDIEVCNAEDQMNDRNSLWSFYRDLIALRKKHPVLVYGDIEVINKDRKDIFTYFRRDIEEILYIECNLGKEYKRREGDMPQGRRLISNYKDTDEYLRPYEASVWITKEDKVR